MTVATLSKSAHSGARLTEIRLYGPLGVKFGRVHKFVVGSVGDAIRCLSEMIPGFSAHMSENAGVKYACFYGDESVSETGLLRPSGGRSIRIAPVIQGLKRGGLFNVVLGAALIVASFYVPPLAVGMGASAATAANIGTAVFSLGVATSFGGVAQLLTPTQSGLSTRDGPNNGASFNMNGIVNTTAQGNPHPLLYGEAWAGSATVSAGIFNEDQV